MRVAYLGIFSKMFKAIFDAILKPVVEVVANILGTVFKFIFENVLMPILTMVFEWFLPYVVDLAKQLFAELFYSIVAYFCKLLDYFENVIGILSGAEKITYKGVSMTLIEAVINMDGTRYMFGAVVLACIGLLTIYSVIALGNSAIDLDFEGKRPVSVVLRSVFKAFLYFLLIPLMTSFILGIASVVMNAINVSFENAQGMPSTLGRIVFCLTTLDADILGGTNNLSGGGKDLLTTGSRGLFYEKGGYDYFNMDTVKTYFDIMKLDYVIGIVVAIFIVVILAIVSMTFVQRIFEVVILFIISPFFVSTMPFDDGEKFKKWKDLFIGKVFSGYGQILAMKLFLLFVPVIMSSSIDWQQSSENANYVFRILFLIGGAWALYKVGPMVTTLISWQAGQDEYKNNATAGALASRGIMMAAQGAANLGISSAAFVASKTMKFGKSALGATIGLNSKEGDPTSKEKADALFSAMEFDGMSSKDKAEFLKNSEAGKSEGGADADSTASSESKASQDKEKLSQEDMAGDKANNEANNEANKEGKGEADKDGLQADKLDGEKDGNKLGKDGNNSGLDENKKEAGNKFDGKAAAKTDDNKGKVKGKGSGKKAGGFAYNLPRKYNSDGTWSVSFFGFKSTYDKDGNKVGFSLPFGITKWKTDKNGNYRVSGYKIPGICKCKLGSNNKFSVSNIPILGIKRQEGQDGQFHVTSALGGIYQQKKGADGKFRTSSVLGVKLGRAYNPKTKDYEVCGIRIGDTVIKGSSAPKSNSEDIVARIKQQRLDSLKATGEWDNPDPNYTIGGSNGITDQEKMTLAGGATSLKDNGLKINSGSNDDNDENNNNKLK